VQLEARAASGIGAHAQRAAQLLDHVLHRIEPDAAAGNFGDGVAHGEAGQEQEFQQLGLGELRRHRLDRQAAAHHRRAHALEVDAAAIVGHADLQHAGGVARLQHDAAFFRLAAGAALRRILHGMVDGVAQQVAERRLQLVEHVAIDLGVLADDLQPHALVQFLGEVAHQARQRAGAVGEGTHAAGDRLLVQAARDAAGALVIQLQFLQPLRGVALQLRHAPAQLGQAGVTGLVERHRRQALLQLVKDGDWPSLACA
jgi:hypothetical protein